MNIFQYVKKYNYTFEEKEFNEVDNLVFALLSYADLNGIITNEKITIEDASNMFDKIHKKGEYRYDMSAIKAGNKLLKCLKSSNRFKNALLYNYEYIGTDKEQFKALTIEFTKDVVYVSFEGTDKLVSGWREDAEMSYKFKVPSQKSAIKYLNRHFTLLNKKIIVGGHSKGGNLALVASMYANILVRNKIIRVFSNDGQGLKKKEIASTRYKKIKDKYTHIIPYNTFVGLLLRHEDFEESLVVDDSLPMILSHAGSSWLIEEDKFKRKKISKKSIKIDKIFIEWLDKYDYKTRELFINDVFNLMKKNNIDNISHIKKNHFKLIKLLLNSSELDETSKNMINDLRSVIVDIDKIIDENKNELSN